LEQEPERLQEQHIDILGVSQALRDLLIRKPPTGQRTWHYWFRHPAEDPDFRAWWDFTYALQLEKTYAANCLWNSARGGGLLFSEKSPGQPSLDVLPVAGLNWQLSVVDAPNLPYPGGWGLLALGTEDKDKILWNATPNILAPYRKHWRYLGQYPSGRSGRTYPRLEIIALLADQLNFMALLEAPQHDGSTDPRQVLLAFGENIDLKILEEEIASELGAEFLPDHIECLPLLPKRDKAGGADQAWCQQHYLTGELYRRQRSKVFCCLSELKAMVMD
jgi:hypothetical protein